MTGCRIAWATLEHLHEVNRCRALFATHYHEMTALAGKLAGVENATVTVKEWEGDVIFLHEVRKGAADRVLWRAGGAAGRAAACGGRAGAGGAGGAGAGRAAGRRAAEGADRRSAAVPRRARGGAARTQGVRRSRSG